MAGSGAVDAATVGRGAVDPSTTCLGVVDPVAAGLVSVDLVAAGLIDLFSYQWWVGTSLGRCIDDSTTCTT
ncbi:hypothetical protein E2562_027250 [Oryza meyeriana var. granulata]|uniref:Uncharacterized protein n=1 Tax=Oryza meyeriana var. granulata TaxID=110450 RepID=A0A6G1CTG7_9ORYZ|nr:hypothetical protein E2562_027250 [Oryza meyeriana var. granulata]